MMGKSSSFSEGSEGFAVLEHHPDDGDAASHAGGSRGAEGATTGWRVARPGGAATARSSRQADTGTTEGPTAPGAGIAGVGRALAAGAALTRAAHGDARRMDEPEAFHQPGCLQDKHKRPHDIEADHRLAAPFGRARAGRPRRRRSPAPCSGPSGRDISGPPHPRHRPGAGPWRYPFRQESAWRFPPVAPDPHGIRMPRLADIALQGHPGHRAISGRARAATRAVQPPRPSTAAGMTTIPASPAPLKLLTAAGALKRGRTA